jgi:hypothetical protein
MHARDPSRARHPRGGRLTPPYQGPRIRAETSATSAERRWTRPVYSPFVPFVVESLSSDSTTLSWPSDGARSRFRLCELAHE